MTTLEDYLPEDVLAGLPPHSTGSTSVPVLTNGLGSAQHFHHNGFQDTYNATDTPPQGRPRVRTVTMDSEDAEQVQILPDLVYEDDMDEEDTLLTKLNTMRKAEKFCDVKLKVGSRNIRCHRVVVACASSHLFELFDNEESKSTDYYSLEDLEPDCVEILVDYAYTARLEVPRDRVKAVYKTATLLKMSKAADACSRFMAENLTTDTCLETRSFANSHCDSDLTGKTDNYIQQNMESIVGTTGMQRLPTIQIEIIGVTSNELKNYGERHLSKMAVDWLEQALQERTYEGLCEDRQVLYLTSDNNLRDCLDLADTEDTSLVRDDLIQDYKKLGKRKKMVPVKGNKTAIKEKASARSGNQNGLRRLSSTEKLASFEKEWKVIASALVGDQNCFCLAMLEDRLTSLSICFRPYPTTPPQSNYDDTVSPSTSPKGSMSSVLDKQCSLQPLCPMQNPRCALGTAVLGRKLVALGGYDRGECHSSMEAYSYKTNKWSMLAPMSIARGRFDCTIIDGKLYACGGSDGTQELKTVECYDPETEEWSSITNMKLRRSNAGVSTVNGKLYVIGGWGGQSGLAECEMYDLDTETWTSIAKLNTGRSQAAVCTLDDKIIALGGNDAWNPMNSVEMYDPDEDKWTYLPPMNCNRRGCGAAVFKGKVYAVGGSDGQSSLLTVEVYDPALQTWTFGPALSVPRANVSVAVIGNRLYAVGGFSGKAFLDSMEYLVEDSLEWCSFVPVKHEETVEDPDCSGDS